MELHHHLDVPDDWQLVRERGPFPFVTTRVFRRADGSLVQWDSRAHRKSGAHSDHPSGSTWWAPQAMGWWIGVLFAIGSFLFALGCVPAYADAVSGDADAITFFIGSIFFTTASGLQFAQAVAAARSLGLHRRVDGSRRVLTWEPARIDWWASVIQLAGTLFFNRSTWNAIRTNVVSSTGNQKVWRPDMLGSVCFLVSSLLAWGEAGSGWLTWRPRSIGWWIAMLNLVGSIAFGVSAVAAKYLSSSDDLRNAHLATLGTFVGAVCFLAGAILLLPERTRQADADRADA